MAIITLRDITLSFGGPPVLDRAQLSLENRERVCLLGRNGEGKSTLMRIIAGQQEIDGGEIERVPNLRVAFLDQRVPEGVSGSVFDIVAQGLGAHASLLSAYHSATSMLGESPDDDSLLAEVDRLQNEIETAGAWSYEQQVEAVVTRLGLDADAEFATLSGGMKRRVWLARALAMQPDILLLDEPTNHLDMPAIAWLEDFILRLDICVLFVTHDRAFMRRVASRILDLDRGKLTSWACDYETYLKRKAAALEDEAVRNAAFDKKLAKEEVWIRQGIQARRTRNEGRVRALKKLREERVERRTQQGKANLELSGAPLSGNKVIAVKNLAHQFEGMSHPIVKDFTTTIWRGDKIGILGANGSGKTTLLRLLLGEITPQSGTVKHGTQLQVAYFDQHRETLDEALTVADNIYPYSDKVTHNGRPRHITAYMQDFLFDASMARAPITNLSGGERARLLLARLFLKPANVLVLDEPTNDLDLETLELLEDLLVSYPGTLLIVSHDREFLENTVTATYALRGDGSVIENTGGLPKEALKAHETFSGERKPREATAKKENITVPENQKQQPKPRKLSNKEREALKTIPQTIEKLEAKHAALSEEMSDPDYYTRTGHSAEKAGALLKEIEDEVSTLFETWEALEARAQAEGVSSI